MSSILKALKKLEEEKSARTADVLKIDTEILRGNSPSRSPYRNVTLLAVLFFVCGSALTYLFVRQGEHPADNQPVREARHTTAAPEEPRKIMTEDNASLAIVPAEPPRRLAKNAPANTQHAKPPKHNRPAAHDAAQQPKPAMEAAPPASPEKQPAAPARHIPAIRVDGIAYHFGSADSLAVVNGATVYAGAVVDGVKVEEIGKDRIRFNYEGEKFEVSLGKSN